MCVCVCVKACVEPCSNLQKVFDGRRPELQRVCPVVSHRRLACVKTTVLLHLLLLPADTNYPLTTSVCEITLTLDYDSFMSNINSMTFNHLDNFKFVISGVGFYKIKICGP